MPADKVRYFFWDARVKNKRPLNKNKTVKLETQKGLNNSLCVSGKIIPSKK